MPRSEVVVEARSVVRDFGALRALDHVDLVIGRGTTLGLVGRNGAGKTTALRLLLGLLATQEGTVSVFGMDPWRSGVEVRRRSGAVLDGGGLYEGLCVADSLEFAGRCWRLTPSARRSRAAQLIEYFELAAITDRKVGTLSRGQRQRAALAWAMLSSPELLLLDEPTAGLDPAAGALLRDKLAGLAREEKVTVVLASHNLGEIEQLCDQVVVLRDGRVAATGSPGELVGRDTPGAVVRANFTGAVPESLARHGDVVSIEVSRGPDEHSADEHSADENSATVMVWLRPGAAPGAFVVAVVGAGGHVGEVSDARGGLGDALVGMLAGEGGS